MSSAHTPLMLWIEGAVALAIMVGYVLYAFLAFKPAHVEHMPTRVRIGAAIQGLTIGLLIGFVLVPVRMQFMEARGMDMPGGAGTQSLAWLPALLLMIAVRRGVLLKAPVLSTYLRAFRRASLLKARDDATQALVKLDEIEARRAPA